MTQEVDEFGFPIIGNTPPAAGPAAPPSGGGGGSRTEAIPGTNQYWIIYTDQFGFEERRGPYQVPKETGGTSVVVQNEPVQSQGAFTGDEVRAQIAANGGTVVERGGVIVATFPDNSSTQFDPVRNRDGTVRYNPTYKPASAAGAATKPNIESRMNGNIQTFYDMDVWASGQGDPIVGWIKAGVPERNPKYTGVAAMPSTPSTAPAATSTAGGPTAAPGAPQPNVAAQYASIGAGDDFAEPNTSQNSATGISTTQTTYDGLGKGTSVGQSSGYGLGPGAVMKQETMPSGFNPADQITVKDPNDPKQAVRYDNYGAYSAGIGTGVGYSSRGANPTWNQPMAPALSGTPTPLAPGELQQLLQQQQAEEMMKLLEAQNNRQPMAQGGSITTGYPQRPEMAGYQAIRPSGEGARRIFVLNPATGRMQQALVSAATGDVLQWLGEEPVIEPTMPRGYNAMMDLSWKDRMLIWRKAQERKLARDEGTLPPRSDYRPPPPIYPALSSPLSQDAYGGAPFGQVTTRFGQSGMDYNGDLDHNPIMHGDRQPKQMNQGGAMVTGNEPMTMTGDITGNAYATIGEVNALTGQPTKEVMQVTPLEASVPLGGQPMQPTAFAQLLETLLGSNKGGRKPPLKPAGSSMMGGGY